MLDNGVIDLFVHLLGFKFGASQVARQAFEIYLYSVVQFQL